MLIRISPACMVIAASIPMNRADAPMKKIVQYAVFEGVDRLLADDAENSLCGPRFLSDRPAWLRCEPSNTPGIDLLDSVDFLPDSFSFQDASRAVADLSHECAAFRGDAYDQVERWP